MNSMKKIVGIIALFFLIVSSFGFVNAESESSYTGTYESTDKDGKILNKLKPRLEKIQKKKPKVLLRLNKRIEKILPKLKEDSRRYYLVFMLNEMIISIINEEDDTSSILDDILEGEYEIEEEDNNEEESEDEETEEDTNEEEDSDEDESGEDEDDSEDEENNNSEDDETSENDETEEDEEEICVISGGDLISLLPNGLDITEDNIEVDIAEWNFDSAIDCEQVDDFHVDFGELNELAEISGVDDVECELIVKDNNLTEIDHIDLDMNGSSQVFDIDGLYINAGNNTLTFGLSCDIEHSVSVSGTFDIEMEFDNASMESSESGDENNVDLTDYELDMDIDVNVNIQ